MQFDSCHGTTFLDFEDVRVPKSNLIGQEGGGSGFTALAVRIVDGYGWDPHGWGCQNNHAT